MDIFKIMIVTLILLLLIQILRQNSPSQAILVSAACCIILLVYALTQAAPIFEFARKLSAMLQNDDLLSVLKCIAIAILTQTTQELCKESGQTALASQIDLCGRIAITVCALPLFTQVLNLLTRLL